ncbi:O-acyltransferase [Plakobranchus ocellatus]|uniref:diacylglycerol O-acyltransferase n=1 Tax=Plakobranchus ocellatus TaxID=259542 RepID=A0AAV4C235_9GAST|nr:O-acyltransferase [Plakobranchus ocellatus]
MSTTGTRSRIRRAQSTNKMEDSQQTERRNMFASGNDKSKPSGSMTLTGGASRPRLGVSSGGKMRESYGATVRKRGRGSGQRMREVYSKIRNGESRASQEISELSELGATNGHTGLGIPGSVRKDSSGSTDSGDSDGQLLCTEDRCIMDSTKSHARKRNVKSASESHVCSKSMFAATTGKLCRFCRGEMQASRSVRERATTDPSEVSTLYSRAKAFRRSLSDMLPKWLSEPEFMMHAKPRLSKDHIHRNTDSLFSTSSGFTNYYGILNLALILLVLGNARLFLENIMKYGILINSSFLKFFLREPYNWPNLLLTMSLPIYPGIALLTEKALMKVSSENGTEEESGIL